MSICQGPAPTTSLYTGKRLSSSSHRQSLNPLASHERQSTTNGDDEIEHITRCLFAGGSAMAMANEAGQFEEAPRCEQNGFLGGRGDTCTVQGKWLVGVVNRINQVGALSLMASLQDLETWLDSVTQYVCHFSGVRWQRTSCSVWRFDAIVAECRVA